MVVEHNKLNIMANHGYCKNCWWYKEIQGERWNLTKSGLTKLSGYGHCYMHRDNETPYTKKDSNSYCPDYINRLKEIKYGNKTLEEWIQGLNI